MSGEDYPPISAYAFLSDTHTAALVGPDGAVEWMCVPRFDGPSIFGRILDRRRGGAFALRVRGAGPPRRRYAGETLVLESEHAAPSGTVVVRDFLAVGRHDEEELAAARVLVRLVTCRHGSARVVAAVRARPDYGARDASWRGGGGRWSCADPALWLQAGAPLADDGDGPAAELELSAGDSVAFLLGYGGEPPDAPLDAAVAMLEATTAAWRAWAARCGYDGLAAEQVRRSALVLRGLAFDETGALLAAPTTSLPEEIGGERNWDYRYTWHRDAALLVLTLFRLGYHRTGRRYIDFLLSGHAAAGDRLRPVTGIGGETAMPERTLDHLEGYAGSRPVRVGNDAYAQVQLDTYGHVLDAALAFQELTGDLQPAQWEALRRLADFVAEHWADPDHGIWEVRAGTRHFVNSKMLAWVCLQRACRLAELMGDADAPVEHWSRVRDEIHADVLERGYDRERGAFVQAYGDRVLDASVLRAFLLGFLPPDDPRVASTVDALAADLGVGEALLHRYDTRQVADGVRGHEGAFLMCSFELVSVLVLMGRLDEARRRFDALLGLAGPVGLFPEEAARDGRPLGNFPQAFTHLALVQAALNLDAAEDAEALHAWVERRGLG